MRTSALFITSRRLAATAVGVTVACGALFGGAAAIAAPIAATPTAAATEANCTPLAGEAATILYFQDTHEFSPVPHDDGERGGIARLQTVLQQQGASSPATDVVFGGDLGGGTLFGGVYRGTPFVEAYNQMGVDVANFGQHDFDYGVSHTNELVAASNFQWLSSNLVNADGTPYVPNTTLVRELGGVKIGYIGLTSGMETTSAKGQVLQRDIVESARAAANTLQAQGVDAIVAFTQLSSEEAQRVMDAVPGINVLLREEGGSETTSSTVRLGGGRFIIEAWGDYGAVDRLDLRRTNCGVQIDASEVKVDEHVTADAALLTLQNRYVDAMDAALAARVSFAPEPLDLAQAGELVAAAFREYTGADLAWMNGGGARAEIPAGDVTLRTLSSVLPFDNKLMTIQVTGAQLLTGLEQGAMSSPSGSGGYPRVAGLSYDFVPGAEPGKRIQNVKLDGGAALAPDGVYSLTLTNYVVDGGNDVTAFTDAPVLWSEGTSDIQALISYAQTHAELSVPVSGEPGVAGASVAATASMRAPQNEAVVTGQELAYTGGNVAPLVGFGAVLLVMGLALRKRVRSDSIN